MYGRFFRAAFHLRSFIRCCACARDGSLSGSEDNCCLCNLAALKAVTGLRDEHIVYLSFHNKIYETPFFVAIDDETKNVVVAIRGTLSLHDAITDLNVQDRGVDYEGLPDGCRAHKVSNFSRARSWSVV